MNTKQTEALKLALPDRRTVTAAGDPEDYINSGWNDCLDAIREALAEKPAQQEPVAWDNCRSEKQCRNWCGNSACGSHWNDTSPPASKPWVELTDEEIDEAQDSAEESFHAMNKGLKPRPLSERASYFDWHLSRAIEAKLREKNS